MAEQPSAMLASHILAEAIAEPEELERWCVLTPSLSQNRT
jgi:hypothetical protein